MTGWKGFSVGVLVAVVLGACVALAMGSSGERTGPDPVALATGEATTSDPPGVDGSGSSAGASGAPTPGNGSRRDAAGGQAGTGSDEAVQPAVAPPTAAPAVSAPTIDLVNQRCSGGKLIASVVANASSGDRKGVQAVTMTRQNDEGAFVSSSNATWLGPDTGAGDQWDATLVGNNQGYGKTLRVTATSESNQTTTREFAISAPC